MLIIPKKKEMKHQQTRLTQLAHLSTNFYQREYLLITFINQLLQVFTFILKVCASCHLLSRLRKS